MKTRNLILLVILIVTICFGSYLFFLNKFFPDTFEIPKKIDKPVKKIPREDSFYSPRECHFALDTFSFKGIKLGAHFNTFHNLKKTTTPIIIYHTNVFTKPLTLPRLIEIEEDELDNSSELVKYEVAKGRMPKSSTEISYEVTGAKKLTIFNEEIERIYLRFYKDTLYQIIIFPKSSIVNLIATKFSARNCLWEHPSFKKIYLSNNNLSIESESCDISNEEKSSNLMSYSYLIVTNNVLKKRKFPLEEKSETEPKFETKKPKKDDIEDF